MKFLDVPLIYALLRSYPGGQVDPRQKALHHLRCSAMGPAQPAGDEDP